MTAETPLQRYLEPHHKRRLRESGITEKVMTARGYETAQTKAAIEKLGFSRSQCCAPALVIPRYNHRGQPDGIQIRPDNPRRNRDGKWVKYDSPPKSRARIDVPPATRDLVLDPAQILVFTEGILKADAGASKGIPCVAVCGVTAWQADDPFWNEVPLKGRSVYIVFDSDLANNPNVRRAAIRLAKKLRALGAVATVLCLPQGANGEKQGLDDYLASGRSCADLLTLPKLDASASAEGDDGEDPGQYRATPNGLVREHTKGSELVTTPLTSFNAWITAEIVLDNGSERRRELQITAELNGTEQTVTVPAERFERMDWVIPELGATAIISPPFTAAVGAAAGMGRELSALLVGLAGLFALSALGRWNGHGGAVPQDKVRAPRKR